LYFDTCWWYVVPLRVLKTDADYRTVVVYTAVGGLKATFITDYIHTAVALILLIYFSLAVLTNEHIGGISGLYHKVKAADDYIEGNYMGSLLTMKSQDGMLSVLCLT
jgi:Na+/proline symporter